MFKKARLFLFVIFLHIGVHAVQDSVTADLGNQITTLFKLLQKDDLASLLKQHPEITETCQAKLISSRPDKVFFIACSKQRFGLRIFGRTEYAKRRGAHRSELAGKEGLGPKILYTSASRGVLLWQWLEGKPLALPLKDETLIQVAQVLKKLHALPADSYRYPRRVQIEERALNRLDELKKTNTDLVDFTRLKKLIQTLQTHLSRDKSNISMIHVDIHQSHLLLTPENSIKLIDWGDSATGDFFDDLAAFSYFFCLTLEQENLFLATYFGAPPTQSQQARLYLKKIGVLLHYSLWHLRQGLTKSSGSSVKTDGKKIQEHALQKWVEANGLNTHFSGNPALSYQLGLLGLKDALSAICSAEYFQAIQAI